MRKTWIIVVVLVALAALWAWPYYGAYSLAKAAERGDAPAVSAQVDFPVLRRSVARQIVRAYLRDSGKGEKLGALGRGMAVAVGTTVADPYLAELLSPDAITSLLGAGRLKPITVENRTIGFDGKLPSLPDVLSGQTAAVLLQSYYDGFISFVFHVAGKEASADDYGVHLRLNGLTWVLSGIDLPRDMLDRIVADIVAKEKASQS